MTEPSPLLEGAAITWRRVAFDRRKHVRVAAAAAAVRFADSDGAAVPEVLDASAGGLRVAAAAAVGEARAYVIDGVACTAQVVWTRDGVAGLAFTSLPEGVRARLMAAADEAEDETEVAAGAPAAPVRALAGAAAPRAATAEAPPRVVPPPGPLVRRWRPPLRAGVYVVLGLMLTAWLGSALYRRVWRIEVDAASIIATTARVASPADGVVGALRVDEGAVVRTGDVLFEVEAAGVESALERVAIEVEEARAAVARREAERVAAVERLRIEGGMARTRAEAERRQAGLLAERVGWAEAQVARLEALAAAPGISPFEVEAARGAHAALSGQLAATRARLAVEAARIRAGARGYAFDGERVAPALPELDAALAEAQTELALAERRHTAERVRAEGLRRARAPFPGRVAALAQPAGAAVRQGTVVVVLEADTERRVEAWVTREEAGYIRLGSRARVYVPGVGRTYDAVVRSLGAEPGASEQAAAVGVAPRLRVLLDVDGYAGDPGTAAEAMDGLEAADTVGLPAVVSFPRGWR